VSGAQSATSIAVEDGKGPRDEIESVVRRVDVPYDETTVSSDFVQPDSKIVRIGSAKCQCIIGS
jgi:hypothetical protein